MSLHITSILLRQALPGAPIGATGDMEDAADYVLAGRFRPDRDRVEYAWVRPDTRNSDRRASGLPPRTRWTTDTNRLSRDLATLRRIHGWLSVTPPPRSSSPYRLVLRDMRTGALMHDTLAAHRVYDVVLRSTGAPAERPRWYYVFVIDSHGNSHLLFPQTGSVENRFPLPDQAPAEIFLGNPSAFRITPPYGIDTYVLLSTEEPLPNPSILEWEGVRARRMLADTPWSIERLTIESTDPPAD